MRSLSIAILAVALTSDMAAAMEVIDLSSLFQQGENPDSGLQRSTAQLIDSALSSRGFFLATGVGLESIYEASLAAAHELFACPLEEKIAVSMRKLGGLGRGYLEFGSETGVNEYFEPKEGFSYGFNFSGTPSHDLQRPNVWPSTLPETTIATLEGVFDFQIKVARAVTLGLQIMDDGRHAMVNSASHEQKYLDAVHDGETISILRLFHYFPPHSSDREHQQLGSSPHTDWGFLTVILHDGVSGLQFYHDGSWSDVPYTPNSVVINAGDFLSRMSQGRYRSPIHRVLCPPTGYERYSFVLFFYPYFNISIPTFQIVSEDTESNSFVYNTLSRSELNISGITFGDYIVEKWRGVMKY